jgi:UDP-N-acetylmuramyl pentapeptide phosphotransferase/UDP-N-acetylglucosamine-1-phosphate transferase
MAILLKLFDLGVGISGMPRMMGLGIFSGRCPVSDSIRWALLGMFSFPRIFCVTSYLLVGLLESCLYYTSLQEEISKIIDLIGSMIQDIWAARSDHIHIHKKKLRATIDEASSL